MIVILKIYILYEFRKGPTAKDVFEKLSLYRDEMKGRICQLILIVTYPINLDLEDERLLNEEFLK